MLALIGGSGFATLGADGEPLAPPSTPFGSPSDTVRRCLVGGRPCLILRRHGAGHQLAPHNINYRANMLALRDLGATAVLALNTVGGIDGAMRAGDVVLPHQLIDYTTGRDSTFFDGSVPDSRFVGVRHVDFTDPLSARMNARLLDLAEPVFSGHPVGVFERGVYGCTNGPRLETAAEIDRMERDGCTIVGMTLMPEAALAAELELPCACISQVVNPAAGRGEGPITADDIEQARQRSLQLIIDWAQAFARDWQT